MAHPVQGFLILGPMQIFLYLMVLLGERNLFLMFVPMSRSLSLLILNKNVPRINKYLEINATLAASYLCIFPIFTMRASDFALVWGGFLSQFSTNFNENLNLTPENI